MKIKDISEFNMGGNKLEVLDAEINPVRLSNMYNNSARDSNLLTFKTPINIRDYFDIYDQEINVNIYIKSDAYELNICGSTVLNELIFTTGEVSIIAYSVLRN